jgi:hypothetical protein
MGHGQQEKEREREREREGVVVDYLKWVLALVANRQIKSWEMDQWLDENVGWCY